MLCGVQAMKDKKELEALLRDESRRRRKRAALLYGHIQEALDQLKY